MPRRRVDAACHWLLATSLATSITLHPRAADADACAPPAAPSAEDIEEARAAFLSGSELAQRRDWEGALVHFRRSFELSGAGASLYNAAAAHEELGDHLEALYLATCLLARDDLDAETRGRVDRLVERSRSSVATLELEGLPREDRVRSIRVGDTERHDTGRRPLEVYAAPGYVELAVTSTDGRSFAWRGRVEASATQLVHVAFTAPLPPPELPDEARSDEPDVRVERIGAATLGRRDDDRGEDDDLSPWLWVGAAVLVAAGAVVGIVLLTAPDRVEPRTDIVHVL
jgi:hypothetical protein